MNWGNIKSIKKFTEIIELTHRRKLGERPVYYLENGFCMSTVDRKFEVKNDSQIYFGDKGEYLLRAFFFNHSSTMYSFFNTDALPDLEFEYQFSNRFEIENQIYIGDTLNRVKRVIKKEYTQSFFIQGETIELIEGNILMTKFIKWKNYTLYFDFESNKLSHFEFILS